MELLWVITMNIIDGKSQLIKLLHLDILEQVMIMSYPTTQMLGLERITQALVIMFLELPETMIQDYYN